MPKEYFFYRPEARMHGRYPLTQETISRIPDQLYGVYLLCAEVDHDKREIIVYVGRGLIRARMTEHILQKDANSFYFKMLKDDLAGFTEECRLFHKYGKRRHLDNRRHPAVPRGAPDDYPRCRQLGCEGEAD